ncbi:MAG: hypothetical protein KF789_01745 [Bdellovibrionaceae bacterium]|nr:hypothetical protein [Pseudobdellovibrionaceae bacterium]
MKEKQSTDLSRFLLIDAEESSEDRQEREKELREASTLVREAVTRAQQACKIQQPRLEETTTGTGKDVVMSKTSKGSVSGAECPISADESSLEKTWPEKLTSMSPVRGLFRTTKTNSSTYRLLDQALAQELNMTFQTSTTKANTLTDTTTGAFKTKSDLQMVARSEYLDGHPMTMNAKMTILGFGNERMELKSLRLVGHVTIVYQEKTYVLSVNATEADGKKTTQAYLNGDPIDENAFKMPTQ